MAQKQGLAQVEQYRKIQELRTLFSNNYEKNSTDFPYYETNEEILLKDPYVGAAFLRLCVILFSDGLAFNINGKFIKPNDFFQSIIENHWKPFLAQMLRFEMCNGFLVWAATPNYQTRVIYPVVPDKTDVTIEFDRNDKTRETICVANWKVEKTPSRLYVIIRQNPYGITTDFRFNIIDLCKQPLELCHRTTHARTLTAFRIADPPFIYQQDSHVATAAGMSNLQTTINMRNGVAAETDLLEQATMGAQDLDDDMNARVSDSTLRNLSRPINQNMPIANPMKRLHADLEQPANADPIVVPFGGVYVSPPSGGTDLNFVPTSEYFKKGLLEIMGLTMDNKLNEAMFKHYCLMFSGYLTSIFNVLHHPDGIFVSDVKPTYMEENRRRIKPDDELERLELFGERNNVNIYGEKPQHKFKVYLTSHVYSDIDLCTQYFKDGLMSENAYYMKFPHLLPQEESKGADGASVIKRPAPANFNNNSIDFGDNGNSMNKKLKISSS